ncbi:hypothetical protein EYF80_015777 [Liparis tanakae]|uniref:Uncharacterized protein n=1 Tax=Liparis tanakae TaxID=230148 RepID=A0A4Z2I7C7_9TELE|nr:hypothetical protein EYF80_015777 [Liparis tanakae]
MLPCHRLDLKRFHSKKPRVLNGNRSSSAFRRALHPPISTSTAALTATNRRAGIPSGARVLCPFIGEQAVAVPATGIHAVGEEERGPSVSCTPATPGPLPPPERSACFGAIGSTNV